MYTHRKLQTEFDRVALNEEDWQGILNRARLRGVRGARASGVGEGELRAPGPNDKIWEIGCQVCYYLFSASLLRSITNYHAVRKGGSGCIPLNAQSPHP
jgi:hypothetical protein